MEIQHYYCNDVSEEQIAEVTIYLKKIHESESLFHTKSLTALRKEQDRIQKRINQMYDDKLDGLIDEKMYLDKVKDYKARQAKIIEIVILVIYERPFLKEGCGLF